jgi:hypothetical protein
MGENLTAKAREDFIRRLFAVSVSVGFASQLLRSPFISGTEITVDDWAALSLMVTALVAVSTSWEGYLASVAKFPTLDSTRFYIDIIIVFSYTALLLLSHRPLAWLVAICGIFVLYVVWDLCRILTFPSKYGIDKEPFQICAALNLQFLSFRSLRKSPDRMGPAITVVWLAHFVVMLAIAYKFSFISPWEHIVSALVACVGLIGYRIAKIYRTPWGHQMLWSVIPLIFMASVFGLKLFR